MLRVAAHLPQTPIRLTPMFDRALDLTLEHRPDPLVETVVRPRVDVDRVENCSPNVVLSLRVRRVANADRTRSVVAVEVIERVFVELTFTADAVHHLEVVALRDLGDE